MKSDLSYLRNTFKVLSEESRIRILTLLEKHELKVNEIQAILNLKQSTLSVHLKLLKDYGLVTHRREGKSIFYQMTPIDKLIHSKETVLSVLNLTRNSKWYPSDQDQLEEVLANRKQNSIEFFENKKSAPSPIDSIPLWLSGFLGLIENKRIIDLGCGSGQLMSFLVQMNQKNEIYGLDNSTQQLKLAKQKISKLSKYNKIDTQAMHLISGDMENTKFNNNFFDLAIISNSLHHTSSPSRAIQEAFRILKNNSKLLIFDLNHHEKEEVQRKYGDFWMGFNQSQLEEWLIQAGFHINQYCILKSHTNNDIDPILVLAKKPASS